LIRYIVSHTAEYLLKLSKTYVNNKDTAKGVPESRFGFNYFYDAQRFAPVNFKVW
jgi:hypothetical protein